MVKPPQIFSQPLRNRRHSPIPATPTTNIETIHMEIDTTPPSAPRLQAGNGHFTKLSIFYRYQKSVMSDGAIIKNV